MSNRLTLLLAGLFLLFQPAGAQAAISDFVGSWRNTDSNTQNLTRLEITRQRGGRIFVHVYGACSPRDCDNGNHQALVFGPAVNSNPNQDAEALFVEYSGAPGRYRLILRANRGRLSYQLFTQFNRGDRRSDYFVSGSMRRIRGGGGGSGGGGGGGGRPPALNEDCLPFNPARIEVSNVGGSWKIVQGRRYMFDFGSNRAEANRSYNIIRRYRFDNVCYVGRPNPSMVYLKRGNGVPSNNLRGDDCIAHNAANYSIRRDSGSRWLLTDGRSRIKVFPNRAEARQALAVINRYRLGQLCYVGRPNPSFEYWLGR